MHSVLSWSTLLFVVTVSAAPSDPGKKLRSRNDIGNLIDNIAWDVVHSSGGKIPATTPTYQQPSPTIPYEEPTTTNIPPPPPKFTSGWCGMHVTQYQKNEDSGTNTHSPEYLIDVSIFDANQQPIQIHDCNNCGTTARTIALNGAANVFKTDLPLTMTVTLGAVDDDAIAFLYGDQSWGSNDQAHHSNWGAYDDGKREGDTGFSC